MNVQEMDALIETLRCGRCSDYLSWPPIVLLSDGTSACGHCTPPMPVEDADGDVIREQALEQVLRKLTFPCKYRAQGCRQRLFFGYVNHDDEDCVFRPLACPAGKCPWSGPMFDVPKHFAEAHSSMLKSGLEFKLQVDEDSEDILLAVVEQVPFLLKYVYTADDAELFFEINCLTLDKASYKLCMFNDFIMDCGASIKRETIFPYNSQRCDGLNLVLDKYLPVLENPECILVNLEIEIERGDDGAPIQVDSAPNKEDFRGLGYDCFPAVIPLLSVRSY